MLHGMNIVQFVGIKRTRMNVYLVEFKNYIRECAYFQKPIDFEIAKHLLFRYRESYLKKN